MISGGRIHCEGGMIRADGLIKEGDMWIDWNAHLEDSGRTSRDEMFAIHRQLHSKKNPEATNLANTWGEWILESNKAEPDFEKFTDKFLVELLASTYKVLAPQLNGKRQRPSPSEHVALDTIKYLANDYGVDGKFKAALGSAKETALAVN